MKTYENYKESADFIKNIIKDAPDIGVILGSGLSSFAKELENPVDINYSDIPGFPISTVKSHEGKIVFGEIGSKKIIVFSGRFHFYEGYSMDVTAYPVRTMKVLGVSKMIVTNAAGGINKSFSPGDLMLIKDHLMLFSESPCRGANIREFGDRFFDMTKAYSIKMSDIAKRCAKDMALRLKSGVYAFMPGPQFETPAEIKAISLLGADAVGMSTVAEVIAAAHCKIETLGISVISNMAAGLTDGIISDEDVVEVSNKISGVFCELIRKIIINI